MYTQTFQKFAIKDYHNTHFIVIFKIKIEKQTNYAQYKTCIIKMFREITLTVTSDNFSCKQHLNAENIHH